MITNTLYPDFFKLAFGHGTPKRALMTALVVGAILTMINHGDVILKGSSLNYLISCADLLCPLLFHNMGFFAR